MKKLFNNVVFINLFTVITFYLVACIAIVISLLIKSENVQYYIRVFVLLNAGILLPCILLAVNENINIKNKKYKFDINLVLMILSSIVSFGIMWLFITLTVQSNPKSQIPSIVVLIFNICIVTFVSISISYRLSKMGKKIVKENEEINRTI